MLTKVLVILALLTPQEPIQPYQRPLDVVIVSPDGEAIDTNTVESATKEVGDALEWWRQLSPVPITSQIRSITVVTSTVDYYQNAIGIDSSRAKSDAVTVFMVNNLTTHTFLYSDSIGFAMPGMGAVWIVMSYYETTAIVAHELGHTFFGLRDLYPNCVDIDIMCDPIVAYHNYIIGCESRDGMGHPCYRVYLTLLAAPRAEVGTAHDTSSSYSPPQSPRLVELVR